LGWEVSPPQLICREGKRTNAWAFNLRGRSQEMSPNKRSGIYK